MNRPYSHRKAAKIRKAYDKNKCFICGQNKKPNSHHLIPYSEGGCGTVHNMMTLCETCHKDYHSKRLKIDIERF